MLMKLLSIITQLPMLPDTPEIAEQYLPQSTSSFGKDLWYVIKQALNHLTPNLMDAASICSLLIGIVLLLSIMQNLSCSNNQALFLVGILTISALLLENIGSLISLGIQTVTEISQYGVLLLPVLTSSLAAQGGGSSALTLYTGTIIFNTILTNLLSKLIIPAIYIYIAVCISNRAIGNETLGNVGKTIKWTITWILKIFLYIFTGYMSITGIVSGTVDAAAIKATRLAISGAVPVVGNILSDASESLIVGVGIAKNTAGVAGLLTILSMWIGPFLKIGIQFTLFRFVSLICNIFADKRISGIVEDFSATMGFLLAATGSIGFIHLLSTICFIKGVA